MTAGFQDREGHLWFATDGGGVSRFDGHTWTTYTTQRGLASNEVEAILQDREGHLWFGTDDGGVSRFDGQTWTTYTTQHGLASNDVEVVLQDREGDLWFATDGSGVSRFDGQTWTTYTVKDGLSHNAVWAMIVDREGDLWLCTAGGVSRFDGHTWTTYTVKDGLPHNQVWAMEQDREGHLWFATYGGGVSRFDGHAWTTYTAKDGLADNDVRFIVQDREGNLWFGTGAGVSRFASRAPVPPPVFINAVVADQRYEELSDLAIPNSVSLVAFEFSAISFKTRPAAMQFKYRLEGHDDAWQFTHGRRIEYKGLPRGHYTFELQAIDQDLVHTASPATVALQVHMDYQWLGLWIVLGVAVGLIAVQTLRVFHRERSLRTLHSDLETSHEQLEHRVEERTGELQAVNQRLEAEIREREQIEEELRHSQKIEAIGQLAAGVAHNFNNVLQAINGNVELALLDAPPAAAEPGQPLDQVQDEIAQAAGIVQQLMRLGRPGGPSEHKPVDLRVGIDRVVGICRKTFDQNIEMVVELPETLPSVWGDGGKLEQVLLNLCLNARDALDATDRPSWYIRISVDTRHLSEAEVADRPGISAGPYGLMRIEDNGIGIDERTQERIFEPFFTTKEVDKGTGLGLSTVYAIVREHRGWIECDSEVGVGTTFTVWLPAIRPEGPGATLEVSASAPAPGTERILIIDDELSVRQPVAQYLSRCGYTAFEAEDGPAGLELLQQEPVELVLLDLSMPKMPGEQVLRQIRAQFPDMKVMIFSGHAKQDQLDGTHGVIRKPVKLADLSVRVRDALDTPT